MSDVKQQIRKLLNIADNDAASEQEIQNALAIAAKLMDRHHLSEDDLATSPQDQEQDARNAEKKKQSAYGENVRMPMWEKQLGRIVADIVGGVGYYCHASEAMKTPAGLAVRDYRGEPMKASSVVFYGIAEDVELSVQLWQELRLAISAMARLRYGSVARGDGAAYAEGFVKGLELQREQRETEEHNAARIEAARGQTSAMVLVARRSDLIQQKKELSREWLTSPAGGGVKTSKTTSGGSRGDDGARDQGRADGSRYNTAGAGSRTRKIC